MSNKPWDIATQFDVVGMDWQLNILGQLLIDYDLLYRKADGKLVVTISSTMQLSTLKILTKSAEVGQLDLSLHK